MFTPIYLALNISLTSSIVYMLGDNDDDNNDYEDRPPLDKGKGKATEADYERWEKEEQAILAERKRLSDIEEEKEKLELEREAEKRRKFDQEMKEKFEGVGEISKKRKRINSEDSEDSEEDDKEIVKKLKLESKSEEVKIESKLELESEEEKDEEVDMDLDEDEEEGEIISEPDNNTSENNTENLSSRTEGLTETERLVLQVIEGDVSDPDDSEYDKNDNNEKLFHKFSKRVPSVCNEIKSTKEISEDKKDIFLSFIKLYDYLHSLVWQKKAVEEAKRENREYYAAEADARRLDAAQREVDRIVRTAEQEQSNSINVVPTITTSPEATSNSSGNYVNFNINTEINEISQTNETNNTSNKVSSNKESSNKDSKSSDDNSKNSSNNSGSSEEPSDNPENSSSDPGNSDSPGPDNPDVDNSIDGELYDASIRKSMQTPTEFVAELESLEFPSYIWDESD